MALVLLPVPVSSPVPLAPIVIGSLKGANKRTWMDFVASGAAHELYEAASPSGGIDKKYRPLRPTPPGSEAASRSPSRERAPASTESKPRRKRQTSRKRARTACIPVSVFVAGVCVSYVSCRVLRRRQGCFPT